jgi:hypothetical protein
MRAGAARPVPPGIMRPMKKLVLVLELAAVAGSAAADTVYRIGSINHTFAAPEVKATMTFTIEAGRATAITVEQGGLTLRGTPMK